MSQRFDRITLHKSRASKIEVRASPIILGHYVTHIVSNQRDSFPVKSGDPNVLVLLGPQFRRGTGHHLYEGITKYYARRQFRT